MEIRGQAIETSMPSPNCTDGFTCAWVRLSSKCYFCSHPGARQENRAKICDRQSRNSVAAIREDKPIPNESV